MTPDLSYDKGGSRRKKGVDNKWEDGLKKSNSDQAHKSVVLSATYYGRAAMRII